MPPTKSPRPAEQALPKAHTKPAWSMGDLSTEGYCAVSYYRTLRAAQWAVKWARLSREQKLVELYECVCSHPSKHVAQSLLKLIEGDAP